MRKLLRLAVQDNKPFWDGITVMLNRKSLMAPEDNTPREPLFFTLEIKMMMYL